MRPVNSPFKFLDSYQQEDADIFFGRATETDALYNALSGVKHLLVYGPSGAGKTSLIECGLRNQFSDADWFAVSIRRGANMTASVFARINEALHEKIDLAPKTKLPKNLDIDFGEAIENLFAERYQPVYLLFDQFEELLILGDEAEKKDFFTRLNRLIRYKVPCRVMLVMREEFIGHLSEFEPLCPSIFQHRFRLEKMGRSNVQSVIQQILEAEKYQSDFRVEQPAALAKSILAKLPDTQREIELAHVQVFLEELWDRATAKAPQRPKGELPTLNSGLVKENDNLERVLDSFLKKQLEQLERSHGEKVPLELLAAMISERHTKLQLGAGDLENALAKNAVVLQNPLPDLLRDLEQRRIIRTLKSGEQTQYEISHDVLALVVGQNLTEDMKLREKAREIYRVYEGRAGMFSREDLDYLRAFEGYLVVPEELGKRILDSETHLIANQKEELEKTRKRLRMLGGLLLAAGVALLVARYFWWDSRLRENEARKAKNETQIALEKANSLINAFYFYGDRFALAYGEKDTKKTFYYIDKSGKEVSKLGRWDGAEQFNWMGLAKVIKSDFWPQNYLLDTMGNSFKVSYQRELKSYKYNSINAIDFSGSFHYYPLPTENEIYKHNELEILLVTRYPTIHSLSKIIKMKNLKILMLEGVSLSAVSKEIIQLNKLTKLYLPNNRLSSLPAEIGELKNLTLLDLRENPIPKTEQEKIRKLLPWCKIEF